MVHAKNYETMSTFVKVMQTKTLASFPDTVYTTTTIWIEKRRRIL